MRAHARRTAACLRVVCACAKGKKMTAAGLDILRKRSIGHAAENEGKKMSQKRICLLGLRAREKVGAGTEEESLLNHACTYGSF